MEQYNNPLEQFDVTTPKRMGFLAAKSLSQRRDLSNYGWVCHIFWLAITVIFFGFWNLVDPHTQSITIVLLLPRTSGPLCLKKQKQKKYACLSIHMWLFFHNRIIRYYDLSGMCTCLVFTIRMKLAFQFIYKLQCVKWRGSLLVQLIDHPFIIN